MIPRQIFERNSSFKETQVSFRYTQDKFEMNLRSFEDWFHIDDAE